MDGIKLVSFLPEDGTIVPEQDDMLLLGSQEIKTYVDGK